jgi:hypothetical protein
MMKRSTALGLLYVLLLYVLAVVCCIGIYTGIYFLSGHQVGAGIATAVFTVFVGALSLWIMSGMIPAIVWAFMRFRREALPGVAVAWALITALLATASFFGVLLVLLEPLLTTTP